MSPVQKAAADHQVDKVQWIQAALGAQTLDQGGKFSPCIAVGRVGAHIIVLANAKLALGTGTEGNTIGETIGKVFEIGSCCVVEEMAHGGRSPFFARCHDRRVDRAVSRPGLLARPERQWLSVTGKSNAIALLLRDEDTPAAPASMGSRQRRRR